MTSLCIYKNYSANCPTPQLKFINVSISQIRSQKMNNILFFLTIALRYFQSNRCKNKKLETWNELHKYRKNTSVYSTIHMCSFFMHYNLWKLNRNKPKLQVTRETRSNGIFCLFWRIQRLTSLKHSTVSLLLNITRHGLECCCCPRYLEDNQVSVAKQTEICVGEYVCGIEALWSP